MGQNAAFFKYDNMHYVKQTSKSGDEDQPAPFHTPA